MLRLYMPHLLSKRANRRANTAGICFMEMKVLLEGLLQLHVSRRCLVQVLLLPLHHPQSQASAHPTQA
jgi:hypothetical protein